MSADYWVELPVKNLRWATVGPSDIDPATHVLRIVVAGDSVYELDAVLYNAHLTVRDYTREAKP